MKDLAANIHNFDNTLFGIVDLSRPAVGPKGFYAPAFLLVLGSGVVQYLTSKQLLPTSSDQRSLREILKSAGEGKQADQSEVNAAVGRFTIYLIPVTIVFFTVGLASALALYWFVSGLVAYIQQSIILRGDEEEMEALADNGTTKDVKSIPEAEVVSNPTPTKAPSKKKKSAKKRRKRS
jgi:membrane protein insertase Oxa1/YidC/SpoIIIJ